VKVQLEGNKVLITMSDGLEFIIVERSSLRTGEFFLDIDAILTPIKVMPQASARVYVGRSNDL